jgi:hypothetical protein
MLTAASEAGPHREGAWGRSALLRGIRQEQRVYAELLEPSEVRDKAVKEIDDWRRSDRLE